MKPTKLELELARDKRFRPIAGVDETAVCDYAGPVYAGAVIMDYSLKYSELIRDCKTLNDGQLEKAYKEVIQKAKAKLLIDRLSQFKRHSLLAVGRNRWG